MQARSAATQDRAYRLAPRARDIVLLGAAGTVLLVDVAAATASGQWLAAPAHASTYYPALIALVAVAGRLLRSPGQLGSGRLMLGVAGSSALLDLLLYLQDSGPAAFVSGLLEWYVAGMFAQLLLRWPESGLQSQAQRAALWLPYAVLPALTLAWQLMWDPAWFGVDVTGWWWPTLLPDRDLAYGVFLVSQYAYVAAIALLLVLVAARVVAAPGPARRVLAPVAIAAAFLALATLAGVLQVLGVPLPSDTALLQNLAILTVPFAVLAGSALQRPARGIPLRTGEAGAPTARRPGPLGGAAPGAGSEVVAALRAHPGWMILAAAAVGGSILLGSAMVTALGLEAVPRPEPQQAPTPPTPGGGS